MVANCISCGGEILPEFTTFENRRKTYSVHLQGPKTVSTPKLRKLKVTIEEARSLLYWSEAEAGFGKMGVCGLSMGGVHAAMVGSLHPTPVATLPFHSLHSAVVAFCEGILKHGTAWEALREDAAQKAAMMLEQVRERMQSALSLTDVTRIPFLKNPEAVIFVAATVSPISVSPLVSSY
ncbi:uncharacterized protein LOC131223969 [Magnolia sinica]|uniref:uncharacterized protein LOC131223969 n=1 Tax=Magnolia sinica TaxID=86752 RepID=UPI00265921E6|nr:uncharacterized protein LOC131223969 [Magnolia sinica]